MFKRLCKIFLTPILLSLIIFLYLQSCPPVSLTLTSYVSYPVDIIRDSNSVPHIHAKNFLDASYAMGYSMAQDRLWQLDIYRRIATGRLSELLGEKALNIDIFMRNIKIPKMVERDLKAASPEALKIFNAFTAGINAGAKDQWLPIEYYLTRNDLEEFTISDIQANIHLMSVGLSNPWGNDILKHQLLDLLGEEIEWIISSDSKYTKPKAFIILENELPEELRGPNVLLKKEKVDINLDLDVENKDGGAGSNAWAISGKHTKSGKPIISNDPHLSLTMPSIWYMFHIYLPNNTFSGMSIAGTPLISIGRNKDFAWTSTSMKTDDVDVYIEKIKNDSFLYEGKYLPLTKFEEKIKVKGQEARNFVFRETIHGPIIDSAMLGLKRFHPMVPDFNSTELSYCFINHYLTDRSMDFLLEMINAKSLEDIKTSTEKITANRLAMIFASTSGSIYYQSTSRIPIRKVQGDRPLAGWLENNTWAGFIPFKEMPYVFNPEKGFIVNANNIITESNYKYSDHMGHYFSGGRAERITELIQTKINQGHKFIAKDIVEMMHDEHDYFAQNSLPHMIKMLKVHKNYTSEVESMKNWDFVLSRNSHPGALWAVWVKRIAINLFGNKIPEEKLKNLLKSTILQQSIPRMFLPDYPSTERLCDDFNTKNIEKCEEVVSKAFVEACKIVDGRTWQDLHIVQLKHMPFSEVPVLRYFFERYKPVGGTHSTIHSTHYNWAEDHFMAFHGPGSKFVVDLGDDEENYWSIQTGVSGNAFSKFYDNLLEKFDYGELERFHYGRKSN